MKIRVLIALCLIAAGVLFYTWPNEKPVTTAQPVIQTQQKPEVKPTVQGLLDAVNAERAKAGVKPLVLDERLNKSAQSKTDDEKAIGYYGHDNPTTGKHGYDLAHEAVPNCTYVSENILVNQAETNTTKASMHQWLNSPAHKEALLDSKYELTGFGITGTLVAEHFCDLD